MTPSSGYLERALKKMAGVDRSVRDAYRVALTMPWGGQISLTEAQFLAGLVRALPPESGPIVEIGTLFGWSTRVMAMAKEITRPIITVDAYCWNPLGLTADEHFAITSDILLDATARHSVKIVRMDKAEFYRTYDGPPPALAFLDADHSYDETRLDIEWALRAGARVVALHDYSPEFEGVMKAVDELGGPADLVATLANMRQAYVRNRS